MLAAAAHADLAETERRLKRAGVDPILREQINESIARGARWLASKQRPDGSYRSRADTLCALALQHAAVPEAQAAYRRSLNLFLTSKGGLKEILYHRVYEGGLAALLLHAEGKHPKIMRKLGAAFAHGEGKDGFWGYSNSARSRKGAGNLSTSQFAVLALWAAGAAGYEPKPEVWKRHVTYLLRSQTLDGSFGYGGHETSYPTGTFMGLANLVVAREALEGELDEKSKRAIAVAREQAGFALARDVPATIAAFRTGRVRDYYALYALEKACLFLDREEVGGVRWYVEGARALLAAQKRDGSWSSRDYRYWIYGSSAGGTARPVELEPPQLRDLESTAFALLFLLRSWESFHPTTPRDLHSPTTTPSDGAKPEPEPPPADPAPAKVPLEWAESLLDELEHRLRTRDDVPALLAILHRVGDAYARLDAPPAEAEAWRKRAEKILLELFGKDPALALAATPILGRTHSRVVPVMTRIADKIRFPRARRDKDPAIYAPVFDALARLNAEEALRWMLDRHLVSTGKPHATPRCRAALRAAVRFRDVPGPLRLAIVKRLLQGYASMEKNAPFAAPVDLTGSWRDLGPAVIRAVQHYARDSDGLPPLSRGVTGGWIKNVREFQEWLRENDDPTNPPWR